MGDNLLLGMWDPGPIQMTKQNDGCWVKTISFAEGTILSYKITLGSWESETLDNNGNVPQNSVFEVSGDNTIYIKIDKWKNQ